MSKLTVTPGMTNCPSLPGWRVRPRLRGLQTVAFLVLKQEVPNWDNLITHLGYCVIKVKFCCF